MLDESWQARRSLTWGASELSPIVHFLGGAEFAKDFGGGQFATEWRKWVKDESALPKQKRQRGKTLPHMKCPRALYRKAGLMARRKAGAAAQQGLRRELEVLNAARPLLKDLFDIAYADSVPRSWFPLIDRRSPSLSATPDSWGTDIFGDHVTIEIKTTREMMDAIPLSYLVQVHAQMAVMNAAGARLVVGHCYANPRVPDGEITVHRIDRNERIIDAVREAASIAGEWLKETILEDKDESDSTSTSECAA